MRYANLRDGLVLAICPSVSGCGGIVPDLSGRGNHGVLTNMDAADYVSYHRGVALDFDGSNDFVNCGILGVSSGAVCMWLRFTWAADSRIFSNNGTGTSVDGAARVNGSNVEVWSGRTSNWRTLWTAAATSTWYHFAFVYAASAVTLFVNGQQQSTASAEFDFVTSRLEIANRFEGNGQTFQGQQDDFRVYRRPLAQQEILLLASEPGIGLRPERMSVFFGAQLFNAAWARNSNVFISPVGAA